MAARLIDVAQLAGVSRATASRVIAGTPRNVDPALVQRVQEAASRLGYRTNHSARSLRTGATNTFGVVVPSLANQYFVQVVGALAAQVRAKGGVLIVSDSENDPAIEAAEIEALSVGAVDGLIIVPVSTEASGRAIADVRGTLPVVQFDRWATGAGVTAVALDNDAAVGLLVAHLQDSGRDRIALVAAEQNSSSPGERVSSFRRWRGEDAPVVLLPTISTDSGRQAAREILSREGEIDAVICAADPLALGLTTALHRAGVAVPEQIMVTGFDDTYVLAFLDPPLTSIRHPLEAMAIRALELVTGPEADRTERVERFAPELVVRTARVPVSDQARRG